MADPTEPQLRPVVTRPDGWERCSGCHTWHPASEFGLNRSRTNGLNAMCRSSAQEAGRRSHAKKRGEAYTPRVVEAVKAAAPDGMTWCNIHQTYCPTDRFVKEPRKHNGLQSSCTLAQYNNKATLAGRKRVTSKYKPAPEGTKWCAWHKQYEPKAEFGRQSTRNRADGLVSMCNEGKRAYSRTINPYNAAKERNRRARKRGNGGRHTGEQIVAMGNRQGWKCGNPLCQADIRVGYDADHIQPLDLDGSDDITNIWLTCIPCNRKKSNKHPIAWARSLGLDPVKLWPLIAVYLEVDYVRRLGLHLKSTGPLL